MGWIYLYVLEAGIFSIFLYLKKIALYMMLDICRKFKGWG